MKKFPLLFLLAFISSSTFSQKLSKPEAFAKLITPEDLRTNLYIIAGPDMEGRETATPGQRKAASYIEDYFIKLGLLPGNNNNYQLFYDVFHDSLTSAALEVNGKAFEMDRDFISATSNISSTMRFSEVVFIGADATDFLKDYNLAGKLVMMISSGAPNTRSKRGLLPAVVAKGAAAIIFVNDNFAGSSNTRKGSATISLFRKSLSPQQYTINSNIAATIIGKDYDSIKNNGAAISIYKANIGLETKKTTIRLQSSDVIGVLPGTDLKDQYVVISAHYDHLGKRNSVIYYGADDDGSGTVSILQIAKAFAAAKAAGKGPRRSIIFLANSGEEQGLWGSEFYTSHPTFPLGNTTVDLNIDMIGRIDPNRKYGDSTNYVYVVGDDKISSESKPISEAQNKKYTKLELDYKYNDPNDKENIYYRSDHYNFAKNGVPIIFYFDGVHADYHRPTDTPDKIDYELMTKRAKLVFYTAWDMANKPDQLKRDIPLDQNIPGK